MFILPLFKVTTKLRSVCIKTYRQRPQKRRSTVQPLRQNLKTKKAQWRGFEKTFFEDFLHYIYSSLLCGLAENTKTNSLSLGICLCSYINYHGNAVYNFCSGASCLFSCGKNHIHSNTNKPRQILS